MSDRWLFALALWGAHQLVFYAAWGGYALIHQLGIAPHLQVMKGKAPPPGLVRRATVEVLIAQALLLPASAWILFPAWRWMGGDPAAPLPSLYTIAAQLIACIFIQDTLFYWSHRALHTRWLFRKVHRKHHDFRHVRGLAAEYAHPVEQVVNLITVMTGPIVLAVHPVTFVTWMVIRVGETIEAHSGYAFTTLASRHAYHHLYAARGCLGSFFGLWDRLMGTDTHWRRWRRDQPHN